MKRLLPILLLVFSVGVGAAEKYCYDLIRSQGLVTLGKCRGTEEEISKAEFEKLKACEFAVRCAPTRYREDKKSEGGTKSAAPDNATLIKTSSDTIPFEGGTYTGELVNGVPHGKGVWSDADGYKYVGEWQNGYYHGQGTYTWFDGRKYVGGFKNGKEDGQGTKTHSKGSFAGKKYVGGWREGKRHGRGIQIGIGGEGKTVGTWKNGKMTGEFTMTFDGTTHKLTRARAEGDEAFARGDYKTAAELFLPFAERGESGAQYTLGLSYYELGLHESLKWMREAATQGEPAAQFRLATWYHDGDSVVVLGQDYAKAMEWYEAALQIPSWGRFGAAAGRAAWNLSTMYYAGEGVPKDEAMAYAYRSIAKTLGHKEAIEIFKADDDFQKTHGKPPESPYVIAQGQTMARQIWAKMQTAKGGKSEEEPNATAKKTGSTGTGFFINNQGHIVTNSHVVKDCKQINTFYQGSKVSTSLVTNDSRNDLALLNISTRPAAIAYFRSGRGIRAGEDILAFGFPFKSILSDDLKGTKGMVNALAGLGNDTRFMQISAPVQPGNSGGPLLDQAGNVVGVVTAKMNAVKMAKHTGDIPQNVNFALKASLVRDMLEVKDIDYETAPSKRELKTVDIFDKAKKFTVLVECLQ